MRALLLGHWLHLATVLCWLTGIAAHAGFQANLDLWLDNPVRFGSIAHALWDPHFGSTAFPVNELPASGFPFWARSVGFVAGGQLLAFGGALEAGALWAGSAVNKNLHPFRCSAALPSALSLLWAGHLGWAAAAPRPAQLLSLVGDLSPLSRAVLLTDTIHHHVAVAAIGLWVSAAWHFFRVTFEPRPTLAASLVSRNLIPWHHFGLGLRPFLLGTGQLNRQVAAACLPLASIVFWNAHAALWLPSAGWVHFSLFPCNALFAHHLWVGSALAAGGCVHFSGLQFFNGPPALLRLTCPGSGCFLGFTRWALMYIAMLCSPSVTRARRC